MSTSTRATPRWAGRGAGRATVSTVRLTLLHTRYAVTETVRIPVAVVGTVVFPALTLLVFIVPQTALAQDPAGATGAVAQLAVFGAMSVALFTHGAGIAEDRALPWDTHLRTLPVGPVPRFVARVLLGAVFALAALVPLVVVALLFTAATTTPGRFLGALGGLLLAGVPLLALGLAIGFTLPAKAALAVAQVLLLPLAFAGGLFLPPSTMPGWLAAVSVLTPTRAGRDLVVGLATGTDVPSSALPVMLAWTVLLGAVAVLAVRRDEGRRFR